MEDTRDLTHLQRSASRSLRQLPGELVHQADSAPLLVEDDDGSLESCRDHLRQSSRRALIGFALIAVTALTMVLFLGFEGSGPKAGALAGHTRHTVFLVKNNTPSVNATLVLKKAVLTAVKKEADEVVKPVNLKQGRDFLGEITFEERDAQTAKVDALCNPQQPNTDPNWTGKGWDVTIGERIQCESRNRVRPNWKTIRFDNWDRNWCWIGIKEICHQNLKTPRSWDHYREEAFRKGLAPDPKFSPFHGLDNPQVCDGARHGIPKPYLPSEEALALKWFHRNVKVYVLNLPKFYNRWDVINKRLQELHIEAERVIGVDMMEPNAYQNAVKNGWILEGFDMTSAQAKAFQPQNDMGHIMGTVGCAAAHFKAQQQILSEKPKLAMVLEDDSWLMDGFVTNIWRIVTQELPCDWDVLQLLGRCAYGKCVSQHLARVQPDFNEPADLCHAGINWGFHGVLYHTESLEKVKELWMKRVFDPKAPHCLDIDVALASISDKVNYYSVPNSQHPPLIKEMDMGSVRASINLGFRVQKKKK